MEWGGDEDHVTGGRGLCHMTDYRLTLRIAMPLFCLHHLPKIPSEDPGLCDYPLTLTSIMSPVGRSPINAWLLASVLISVVLFSQLDCIIAVESGIGNGVFGTPHLYLSCNTATPTSANSDVI